LTKKGKRADDRALAQSVEEWYIDLLNRYWDWLAGGTGRFLRDEI